MKTLSTDPNPHRTFLDTSQNVYKVSFLTPVLAFTFFFYTTKLAQGRILAFYNLIRCCLSNTPSKVK